MMVEVVVVGGVSRGGLVSSAYPIQTPLIFVDNIGAIGICLIEECKLNCSDSAESFKPNHRHTQPVRDITSIVE